jgi:hypothetical protein
MNSELSTLPNISVPHLDVPTLEKLEPAKVSAHPPRILLLYGSLREKSYSRFLTLEAERILQQFGAETRVLPAWFADGRQRFYRPSEGAGTSKAFRMVRRAGLV